MKRRFIIASAIAAILSMAAPAAASAGPMLPASAGQIPFMRESTSAWSGNLHETILRFQIKADKYYDEMGFSTNHYACTDDEIMMLAKVIHLEVRGEPYAAKLAVGNVVMNRVLSPGYPGDTIEEVVTRPNQFCYNPAVKPMAECVRAARDVLEREIWVIPQDIYFFRAVGSRADWGKHDYYKHIGQTAFYHDYYPGRSTVNAIPAALNKRIYEWPRYGCEPGLRVVKVQKMLNALGYKVKSDGYFDADTRDVLIRFQGNEGLTMNGVADPATLKKLITKSRGKEALWIIN